MVRSLPPVALALLLASPAVAQRGPIVLESAGKLRGAGQASPAAAGSVSGAAGAPCAVQALAKHGEPVPGGGTLSPVAFVNPATTAGSGRIAFSAQVSGSPRNQGVFTADALGLRPIAMGCGGGGGSGQPGNGCGDPAPIGGTFSGLFTGTIFAPATNAAGDVLFLADVDGGFAPRGLFLWREAVQSILAVAVVGDASPAGGTLGAIGPGSLGENGEVVFLATGATPQQTQILMWTHGALVKVAAVGDPAPGGGTYTNVGGESFGFADGTWIPTGPLPDVNAAGDVAFRGIASTGARGIVVVQNGVSAWYVRSGDPTPQGDAFFDMQAASLNNAAQIAFFADVQLAGGGFSSAWYAGAPGSWRKALGFFDPVDGGQCFGLAFSRNPMSPLDDDGDLYLWTNVKLPSNVEREALVVSKASGALEVVARQGDPTPLGGSYSTFDAWPSLDPFGRATVSAATPGASGGVLNAHLLASSCNPPASYCTAKVHSGGCAPAIGSSGTPSVSSPAAFTISAGSVLNQALGMLIYGAAPAATAFQGGFLCIRPPVQRTAPQSSAGNPPPADCSGSFALDFNAVAQAGADPLLVAGQVVFAQYWYRDPGVPSGSGLSDALRFTLGP